jgi:hypothetical protein
LTKKKKYVELITISQIKKGVRIMNELRYTKLVQFFIEHNNSQWEVGEFYEFYSNSKFSIGFEVSDDGMSLLLVSIDRNGEQFGNSITFAEYVDGDINVVCDDPSYVVWLGSLAISVIEEEEREWLTGVF